MVLSKYLLFEHLDTKEYISMYQYEINTLYIYTHIFIYVQLCVYPQNCSWGAGGSFKNGLRLPRHRK